MHRLVLAASIAATSSFGAIVNGAVTFNFNYLDAAGIGFNAAGAAGMERRDGLQQAGSYIASVLGPAYTATINIDVIGSVTNDTTLASASSNFNFIPAANGFDGRGDVQIKILNGDAADPAPAMADGQVNWNFEDFGWGVDTINVGEYDLVSTAIHEITHALGFASDIAQNGDNGYGVTPGNAAIWSPFDEFVAFTDGLSIIDATGVLDGAKWDAASIGGTGPLGLQFNGPNAVAAAGGPVYLYSPTTWEGGSSGSHLDTDYYLPSLGRIENMMNHNSTFGPGQFDIRAYTMIELGILKDIGYTQLVMVPEPSAVFLVLGGAVGCFASARRRS